MRTIGVSPDCNLVACLKQSFEVAIFDKKKGQLSVITGLNKSKFVGREIDVDPFKHNIDAELSEANLKDQF